MKKKIIPIFIPHQGCPNDCVFCNQKRITGKGASIDFEEIKSDIEDSLKTIKPDTLIEIAFFGGSFTAINTELQRRCLEIANYYKSMDARICDIRISTRPDAISKEKLEFLKMYNVSIIELGVQSLDEQVLISSERGHDSLCVYSSSSQIQQYGFTLGLQMMVGLPKDSEEKVIYTAREFIKIKPDYVRIYPVLVIKDTKLEEQMLQGAYSPISVEESIEIVKKIYLLFVQNKIKVIRIGLQTTQEINENESVIAGPFHPAFGELVFSRLYRDYLEAFLIENKIQESIVVQVNKHLVSQLVGNKKENISYIYNKLNIGVRVKENKELNIDEFLFGNSKLSISDIYSRLFLIYF